MDDQGTTGLPQVTLTYGYDSAGNRTSLDDSLGGLTSYAYDARNELTSLSQSGSGVASKLVKYTYDNNGNITALDRYGDLTGTSKAAGATYAYDNAERLTGITYKTGAGAAIASYAYTLDAASRLTQEVRTWSGGSSTDTLTYTYTDDGQLTSASHSNGSFTNETFSYDDNGNRDSTGYSTGTDNRISSDGGVHLRLRQRGERDLPHQDLRRQPDALQVGLPQPADRGRLQGRRRDHRAGHVHLRRARPPDRREGRLDDDLDALRRQFAAAPTPTPRGRRPRGTWTAPPPPASTPCWRRGRSPVRPPGIWATAWGRSATW